MKKITEPGIYEMPEEEYHADPVFEPSASSSFLKKVIDKSPRHAYLTHPALYPDLVEKERTNAMDFGSALHRIVLGKGDDVVIVEANDWRTKAAKEAKAAAYAASQTPILQAQADDIGMMVGSLNAQLKNHPSAGEAFRPEFGKSEQVIVWQDEATGVWCRIMVDWLPQKGNVVYDYKTTTNAHPDEFRRRVFDLGHDLQAAFYCMGLKAVCGMSEPQFRFVVQEKEAPYAMSLVQLGPAALVLAEARVRHALDIYAWCLKNDRWPGYPSDIAFIDAPIWYEQKHEDDKVRREVSEEQGESLIDTLIDWQAPKETEGKTVEELLEEKTGGG